MHSIIIVLFAFTFARGATISTLPGQTGIGAIARVTATANGTFYMSTAYGTTYLLSLDLTSIDLVSTAEAFEIDLLVSDSNNKKVYAISGSSWSAVELTDSLTATAPPLLLPKATNANRITHAAIDLTGALIVAITQLSGNPSQILVYAGMNNQTLIRNYSAPGVFQQYRFTGVAFDRYNRTYAMLTSQRYLDSSVLNNRIIRLVNSTRHKPLSMQPATMDLFITIIMKAVLLYL